MDGHCIRITTVIHPSARKPGSLVTSMFQQATVRKGRRGRGSEEAVVRSEGEEGEGVKEEHGEWIERG